MAVTLVVAYDITDDARRAKVAATVQRRGDRIQKSVFLCTMEDADVDELRADIARLIDPETDSVYLFRQCATCWDTVGVHGQAHADDEPRYWAVL